MTKRSTASNLGRRTRKAKKSAEEVSFGLDVELPNGEVVSAEEYESREATLDPQQMLHAQVATARAAFARLAEVRAADLVLKGLSFDDAAQYVRAEIDGLDQQLARCVPPEAQE